MAVARQEQPVDISKRRFLLGTGAAIVGGALAGHGVGHLVEKIARLPGIYERAREEVKTRIPQPDPARVNEAVEEAVRREEEQAGYTVERFAFSAAEAGIGAGITRSGIHVLYSIYNEMKARLQANSHPETNR
jgi:hypothetical protein